MRAEAAVVISLLTGPVSAQVSEAPEEVLPDGLLEFLGEMIESDGELVDPLALESPVERVLSGEGQHSSEDGQQETEAGSGRNEPRRSEL